mmetsp:Transcript_57385/g.64157  ORF Transcript_57385/g.64157 Transcript_57385/m.64157 type:complete len:734 (+) Transcript_57385:511-2712(+)|eukprot:CAMPEP_0170807592 /NCGR_PEP_ID=MMETSP0733-20121128/32848_1 /TAXON_ID=186038 /ORGANISM="Fragilariopsis kerguelensis, Strain L26-C5" /LENGTH=733 /DNA_ID=CAMNT_0011162775 /DNA_START=268 /DNA_END=2469 /DNA_ORIENTATION=+
MKQYFNEMGEEQLSTEVVASSAKEEPQRQHELNGVMYETTTEGDVAVVQPSFDDHDGRSPVTEKKSVEISEKRSSPINDHATSQLNCGEGHKKNLSEHFQDATTLSHGGELEAGQKHRREYSGDVSNPAQAHRRINSIGNSTSVQRGKPHRRIDSSGLDALTAAADFSREELEAASSHRRHSWNRSSLGNLRRSPIETSSTYDHHVGKVPTSHHPPPPPTQHSTATAHHRHYSSLSSSGGLQSRPVYYSHHPPYNQPSYPHPSYYHHHPGSHHGYGTHSQPTAPPPGGYPVQYSRGGQESYKQHNPLQQPTLERPHSESPVHRASPTISTIDNNRTASTSTSNGGMDPPAAPSWRRGGSTQGVQTYITGIGVGETTRTLEVNPVIVPSVGHHRKLSSFSNLGPFFFGPPSQPDASGSGSGIHHHRKNSSSISFLNVLDTNLNESSDATFLRNLQESTGTAAAAAYNPTGLVIKTEPSVAKKSSIATTAVISNPTKDTNDASSKLMSGGTSKRVRRKCTVGECDNRVVQGGLCIAHGAKRKQCKHPGCTKHVKKAGLCSTHGPSRKRCEFETCNKVAVQGGRCIAHGARKKLCIIDACTKQAILGGMCKKHHDQSILNSTLPPGMEQQHAVCTIIEPKKVRSSSKLSSGSTGLSIKTGHTRGLSIFQEISPDAVGDFLSGDGAKATAAKNPATTTTTKTIAPEIAHSSSVTTAQPSNHHHRSTVSQLLVDIVET